MENTKILHYEIVRLLGRGGMGEVYEARDTRLKRLVALKFIAPELSGDPEITRRFEREALSAAALSHPHIATLHALERGDGRVFIVTELMGGERLRDRMARGRLPMSEALAIARDVAAGLAHAHRRGIVHRDIKPENLMFDEEGAIKIMDFGLASAAQASQLTVTGSTMGTPSYMAPEALKGKVDARADVFALGVVLYEMLAGSLPFPGENALATMYMIAQSEPRPLRASVPDLPPEVEAAVADMLIKDPQNRPDAGVMARTLAVLTGATPPPIESALSSDSLTVVRRETLNLEVERIPERREDNALLPARRQAASRWLLLVPIGLAAGWLAFAKLGNHAATGARPAAGDAALEGKALGDDAARFLMQGNADSAQARATAALALDPANAGARVNLAQALRVLGKPTFAADEFARVAKDSKAAPDIRAVAYQGLADIAMDDGTWVAAAEYLTSSCALDSSERARSQLGYALVRSARPLEALVVLRRGLAEFPGSAALHKNVAFALFQLDSLRAARAEVDHALALDAGFTPALGLRARIKARTGDAAGAASDWKTYLARGPSPADSAEIAQELRLAGAAP
jgi:Tfp pilus assembly protein PilF